jgi:hypothetical protein
MRTAAIAASLIFIAACAPKEKPAEAPAPPPPPPAPTVADYAGTWNTVTNMTGAAAPVETQLVGGADGTWTMMAKGRDPIPLTVSLSGDSLIAVSAEYESLIRKGVKVTIRTASVRTGDTMNGNVVATYKAKKGDEVVTGTMTSTKAQ